MEKKKYVTIQSSITINVIPGLTNVDITNKDSDVANRLKVEPVWPKQAVLIREGKHQYPAEVAEWPTVKALDVSKKLSIVGYSDEADNNDITKPEKRAEELNALRAEYKAKTNGKTTISDIDLSKLAE